MNVPIVVRGPANGGTNVGATHSHTPENLVANHPGLKVVCPSNAYDAKGLMKSAIRDNDPVFVMENTLLYGEKWEVPEEEYVVELGVANVLKEGSDMIGPFSNQVLTMSINRSFSKLLNSNLEYLVLGLMINLNILKYVIRE